MSLLLWRFTCRPSNKLSNLQGAKSCIIGDPKSFFALYKPVLGSGAGRMCHFDRDGRFSNGCANRDQLVAAVKQACETSTCLLVSCELAQSPDFPLTEFQQVVVYASEPDSQACLQARLQGLMCPLHFLQTAPSAQLLSPSAKRSPPQKTAQQQQHRPRGVLQQQAGSQGPGKNTSVLHAARMPAVPADRASTDWPVIISSDPCRPIRCPAATTPSASKAMCKAAMCSPDMPQVAPSAVRGCARCGAAGRLGR
jgi:hypothetical protein